MRGLVITNLIFLSILSAPLGGIDGTSASRKCGPQLRNKLGKSTR